MAQNGQYNMAQNGLAKTIALQLHILSTTPDKDTGDGKAATHQLYSFAKEVWYTPMKTVVNQV